jgi:hypothetical protein
MELCIGAEYAALLGRITAEVEVLFHQGPRVDDLGTRSSRDTLITFAIRCAEAELVGPNSCLD